MRCVKILAIGASMLLTGTEAMAGPAATTIDSCVNNSTGAVRIVASSAACNLSKEHFVTWAAVGPAGPTGATGSQGLMGSAGNTGATGQAGPAGAAGGQVWSANMALPSTVMDAGIGPASGLSTAVGYSGASSPESVGESVVLQVPQTCTASHFNVTVYGARNGSQATVTIMTPAAFDDFVTLSYTALSCTVAANYGEPVSCSTSATQPFIAGTYLGDLILEVGNFTNPSDFDSARILASFVCQ
ncbi:MAG: hypothetical protein ACRD3N_02665 [Terracidiphilus sp.]